MDKNISELFDYGDEIAVVLREDAACDPAEIKELTMKRIHDEMQEPIPMTRAGKKARSARRTALIAAIAAVLLAGTALAVYTHTLRDAAIENVPTRESQEYEWKAGETETRLSINGFADSPEYQAYVEWTDWNREWNAAHPDYWKELGEDDSYHETPMNYLVYDAWYAEQGEKLDEIAAKYGLTLLSTDHFFRTETQLCRALGLENITADGYDLYGDYFYDNGTFKAAGETAIDGKSVDFTIWNAVKGSFVPLSDLIPEEYEEWSYTTKDGFEVILMTDTLRGRTTVIVPLSGSFVTATLRTDDAQAAQDFADAIDLPALDALFATDDARAAAARSIAEYVENLSSMTTIDEIGEDEQAILDYLGDWYPTALPEGVSLYAMSVETPSHFEDFYHVSRRYDGMGCEGSLFYRELDPLDGENDETRQQLETYSLYYRDPMNPVWVTTPCTVSGYEAVLSEPNGAGTGDYILSWVDTDRQLFFRLGLSGLSADELMAVAESIDGTAPETPPVRSASAPEERFAYSLMPLGDMQMYGGETVERSVQAKRVLAELGNYGLTELPAGAGEPIVNGQRSYMYEYYFDGRADWGEVWKTYRSDPELGFDGLMLCYRRFDGGRTAEAFDAIKRYDEHYADVAECTVGGQSGYIAGGDFYGGQVFLMWYDEGCDLIFRLSASTDVYPNMTDEELIAFAESVTEQPWTGAEQGYYTTRSASDEPERVTADLGTWTLPGAEYGSVIWLSDERADTSQDTPFWFVADGPYESESAIVTYADGLALGWQRTWADTERTAENGADSFAAITRYILACGEDGAVQTGLSVNGQDAICISYPYQDFFEEAVTQLMWYDADADLIFSLSDFPGADGAPRTAAQLIALAETVTAQ